MCVSHLKNRLFLGITVLQNSFPISRKVSPSIKVLFINNDGGGFADYIEVEEGTTVRSLFKPEDYLIRVNRQPAASDQVVQDLDRVSFTARKIEGACR